MPFPNFHSGRVKNPDAFVEIKVLTTLPNGIMIYGGRLKSDPEGSTHEQTYRFPKDTFTPEQAKKWLKNHNIEYISFEEAADDGEDDGEKKTQNMKSEDKNIQSFTESITLIGISLQAFSNNDIIHMIPGDIMSDIKSRDPHPYFRAYVMAHEGESSPVILEGGQKIKTKISWPRQAVETIKNLVRRGIQFFRGHNADNSTVGRESLGEIVAGKDMTINGKLSHVVVGYFPPGTRDEVKKYDVCSMEAIWNLAKEAGRTVADSIKELTGIALGNSNIEKPAFSGASVLGTVQAFDEEKKGIAQMENLSIETVKQFLRDGKWFPHQVYDQNALFNDDVIIEQFRIRDKQIENLKAEKADVDKKVTTYEKEKEAFRIEKLKNTAGERWRQMINEGNLNKEQKVFMEKQAESLKTITDCTDEGLKRHFEYLTPIYEHVASTIIRDNAADDDKNNQGTKQPLNNQNEPNPFMPKDGGTI